MTGKHHGMLKSPVWYSWAKMKARCLNPNSDCWARYGGRGITVCERWLTFTNFFQDMGHRPTRNHTLDRKDNNRGYYPGNCRWATRREQQNNMRSNRRVTIFGERKTVSEWAMDRRCMAIKHTFYYRIHRGWSPLRALTTVPRKGTA